jgi:hypothetical protein
MCVNWSECPKVEDGAAGATNTDFAGGDVQPRPTFCNISCEAQARVLVHELAHHIPGFDMGYRARTADCARLNKGDAPQNADSYAQFAFDSVQRASRRHPARLPGLQAERSAHRVRLVTSGWGARRGRGSW